MNLSTLIAQAAIYLPLILSGSDDPIMIPAPPVAPVITPTISVSDFNLNPDVDFAEMVFFEDGSGGLRVTWESSKTVFYGGCIMPSFGCSPDDPQDDNVLRPFVNSDSLTDGSMTVKWTFDLDACLLTVYPPDLEYGIFGGFNCGEWPMRIDYFEDSLPSSVEYADFVYWPNGEVELIIAWHDGRRESYLSCVTPDLGCTQPDNDQLYIDQNGTPELLLMYVDSGWNSHDCDVFMYLPYPYPNVFGNVDCNG
jgi:hypothetical protein